MQDEANVNAALRYAEAGWPVLPLHRPINEGCSCGKKACPSPGKHPRTRNGVKDATTDPETIKQWWSQWPEANVGIATGRVSDLVVVDVDEGKGGAESLENLQKLYGTLPPTREVRTGAGRHLYYRYSAAGKKLLNAVGLGGFEGIDLRTDGGYVVAPFSQHANGTFYHWLNEDDLAPLPDIVVTLAMKLESVPDEAAPAKNDMLGLLEGLEEGNRNQTFMRLTNFLHQRGLAPELIKAFLRPYAERSGFAEAELTSLVDGFCRRYADSFNRFSSFSYAEEIETAEPLQPISLNQLLGREYPAVPWLVEDILPKQGAMILAAQEGRGKTWILLDLAICVALGIPWLGRFRTEPTRVVYFDFECIESFIQKRAQKLVEDNPLRQGDADLHFVFAQDTRFGSPVGHHQLVELIQDLKPGLIIVDSLIRAFGGDENSSKDVSEFLGTIKKLMREHNFAVIFADHHRKMGAIQAFNQQVRGSTDKTAFVDCLLTLYRDEDILVIDHTKSRYSDAVPAFEVKLVDTPTGGLEIAHIGEHRVEKAKAAKEDLLDVLKTGLAYKDHITRQDLKELALSQGMSEKNMDRTLDRLLQDGVIVRETVKEEGKRGNGKFVFRWAQASGRPSNPDLGGEAA